MSHLGIITALSSEASCFSRDAVGSTPVPQGEHASLVLAGMGQEAGMAAARQLLDNGATVLISFGMAGALSPALQPGDILLPARVCQDSRQSYACDTDWRRRFIGLLATEETRLYEGDLYSTTRPVAAADQKAVLARETDTIAVDMESAAIMQLACERQVPALVLRCVVDPADFTLPQYILDGCNQYGEISTGYLLKSLLMNPLRSIDLLRLAGCHRQARTSLARCARILLQAQQLSGNPAIQGS